MFKYFNPTNWLNIKGSDPNKTEDVNNNAPKGQNDKTPLDPQPPINPNTNQSDQPNSNTNQSDQPNSNQTNQPNPNQPNPNQQPPRTPNVPPTGPPTSKPTKRKRGASFWIWLILLMLLFTMMFSAIFAPSSTGITADLAAVHLNSGNTVNGTSYWYYDWYIVVSYQYQGTFYFLYFDDMAAYNAFYDSLNAFGKVALPPSPGAYTGPGFFAILLTTWLPWLLIMVLAWVMIKRITEKQSGAGRIQKTALTPQVSNVKLSNVAGYEEIKAELTEIVDFLKQPAKYQMAGARTPKGVLLSGPPGTGKTLFAKAVAGEANIPFYSISGSDFVEMFVGVGASRVRSLFEQAKKTAPSLIFVDELDAVGRMRGAGVGGGNDEREQTLNQLLVEMDGFSQNNGIIVMAATNRPDVLDPALKRPGRFDRSIEMRLPDLRERQWILQAYAKVGNKKISSKIDWKNIAQRTPGFSGAELENVVNEAAILTVRFHQNEITLDIIDEAIDRVIGGPSKINNLMSKSEKELVAHHEVGHAIIGLVLPDAEKVQKISIIPRGQAGGYVLMTPKKEKFVQTKLELMAKVISYMGGRASEEIFFGKDNITTGAHNDIQEATKIARRMVTEFGMSGLGPIQYEKPSGNVFLGRDMTSEKAFSSKIQYEIDVEVRKIIDLSYEKALSVIKNHKPLIELLATALILRETLNAEETEYIFKNKKLPDYILKQQEATRTKKASAASVKKIVKTTRETEKK